MKKIVFLVFSSFILLFASVYAQKQNIYFLKKNGYYVKNVDSADFIRIVQEPEKGSTLYPTKEFYKSGPRKSYGYSSRIDPPLYEGQFLSFFENGKKKQYIKYVNGKITDTTYNYFPNGEMYSALFYTPSGDSSIVYVKSVNDSTGTALVTDGNGHAVFYDEDFEYITGKGNVKNGRYDGEWTGELRAKDTLHYKEVYAEGKMLSGTSNDGKGNVYHYTTSEVKPHFKGGMKAFYEQIKRLTRYPPDLAAKRVQGVAHIKFIILKNGEISNVQAINDVHPGLAAEAIRVIKKSKGWQPGVQKGRLVSVSYFIPMSFSLGR
jgi:TonB family protein